MTKTKDHYNTCKSLFYYIQNLYTTYQNGQSNMYLHSSNLLILAIEDLVILYALHSLKTVHQKKILKQSTAFGSINSPE